ncbi:Protein kinase binding, partial [Dermatophagoides farinae]
NIMETLRKLFANLTNAVVHGGNVVDDDGPKNAVVFDPTHTIETEIKNIKISQKIDYLQKQQPSSSSSPKNNDNEKCKNRYINWQDYYQSPKNLPDDVIDYDRTQLKNINSEPIYAFEIFEYLREKEQSTRCQKYMQHQIEISPKMRAMLVDWMVKVQQNFEFTHEVFYHAIKIIDHFLMNKTIKRNRLQLLGIVSIYIAAKCDKGIYNTIIKDFIFICNNAYTCDDIIKMEIEILQVLEFNLNYPLSYSFLDRYAHCSSQTLETLTLSRYILESSLMDYSFVDELDSKMAAASLLLAIRMKHLQWNKTLDFYTGYNEEDLIELAGRLNRLIKTNTEQESIRIKYSKSVFFAVANIKPLDDI